MKIKVVLGQTTFFACKNLINHIDRNLDSDNFVLVPDRFSLQVESLIMDILKIKSTFNIEVLGLSRLANRVLKKLGFVGQTLSQEEILLITQQAIENVKFQFKSFKKTSINFAQEVSKVVAQFKSSNLAPQDIKPKNCNQSVANKYHDLGLIYSEYENLLGSRFDSNKLLMLFSELILKSNVLADTNLYLAGFDSFTSEMFSIICTLAKGAKQVCIALPKATNNKIDYIYENDILHKLIALCKKENIMIEVVDELATVNENQKAIIDNLFVGGGKLKNDFFTPIACQNLLQEVQTVGKLINEYVREGGRYKDIVVACSNLEKYLPILQRVFTELDIPYFADASVKADHLILAKFVNKYLKVVSSGFSKDCLLDYFSDNLLQKENEQTMQTITKFNVHGKAKCFKYLSHLQPDDLNLFDKLSKAQTNEQFCDCVSELTTFYQANFQQNMQQLQQDYLTYYNLNKQSWQILHQALESIRKLRGQTQTSVGEFIKTINMLMSFCEVSTVPTYVDSVMVGDATSSYFVQCKKLIVLSGAESLPRLVQDNGLVSDNDIESVNFVRKLEPSIKVLNRRNRFKLFNLLSLAQESIITTFCTINEDGKKIEMPNFIQALQSIFDESVIKANFLFKSLDESRDQQFVNGLGSAKHAMKQLGAKKALTNRQFASLSKVLQLDSKKFVLERDYTKVESEKLFFARGKTGVSQIECYFSCPFKHFVRYGLRVNEDEQVEIDQKDIGNICHAFAQEFVLKNGATLAKISKKETEKFIDSSFDNIISKLNLQQKLEAVDESKVLKNYIIHQCNIILNRICYEQQHSLFKPILVEKQLEGVKINVEGTQKQIGLIGKVDRIDTFNNYFRIIDYKTGKVDPLIKDLYYGDKLQLFVYQKGIEQMQGGKAAGVFYFDCKFEFYEDNSATLLKGIVLNDEQVVAACDDRLGVQDCSDIIAVQTRKDIKRGMYKGSALCKHNLINLQEYATRLISKALGEILQGYISPMPDEDACKYCKFNGICLYDRDFGFRKKSKTNEDDILKVLEGKNGQI